VSHPPDPWSAVVALLVAAAIAVILFGALP